MVLYENSWKKANEIQHVVSYVRLCENVSIACRRGPISDLLSYTMVGIFWKGRAFRFLSSPRIS